ncbi:MAG: hypothetical protein CL419_11600 [Acidimicrobiaceae bacterium]|nr:hypothetical protein [Acidimicrobiaceae bacterium]
MELLQTLGRRVRRVAFWYLNATSALFGALGVAGIALVAVEQETAGAVITGIALLVVLPARLESVESMRRTVAEHQKAIREVSDEARRIAQASRKDALAAVATSRAEWSRLLRAERELTESTVRRAIEFSEATDEVEG